MQLIAYVHFIVFLNHNLFELYNCFFNNLLLHTDIHTHNDTHRYKLTFNKPIPIHFFLVCLIFHTQDLKTKYKIIVRFYTDIHLSSNCQFTYNQFK